MTGGLTTGPTYYVGMTTHNGGNFLSVPASQRPPTCAPAAGGSPAITTDCLLAGTAVNRWSNAYASLLGLMDHSAQIATRDGNFIANPLGAPLIDHVHTHSFDTYVQDTWKATHTLTFTYGLSYGVQFAPHEIDGKQVKLVKTVPLATAASLVSHIALSPDGSTGVVTRNAEAKVDIVKLSGDQITTASTLDVAPRPYPAVFSPERNCSNDGCM